MRYILGHSVSKTLSIGSAKHTIFTDPDPDLRYISDPQPFGKGFRNLGRAKETTVTREQIHYIHNYQGLKSGPRIRAEIDRTRIQLLANTDLDPTQKQPGT